MTATTEIESGRNETLIAAHLLLGRLICDESGQDLIEYALVFSFVALGAVASMRSLSGRIVTVFAAVGNTLTSAI